MAGLLAALLTGFGMRWLFVADAVTCLACAALVGSTLPGGVPDPVRSRARGSNPWRDRRLLAMFAAGTAFAMAYLVMIGGLPLALHHEGVPLGWAGCPARRLRGHGGRRAATPSRLPAAWASLPPDALGYLLLALGLGLAAPAAVTGTGLAYVAPVAVWSLGNLVLLGEPFAVVAELAAPSRTAAATWRRTA